MPVTPSIIPAIPARPLSLLVSELPTANGMPPGVLILSWGAKLTLCNGKKAGGALESASDTYPPGAAKRRHDSKSLGRNSLTGVGAGNVNGGVRPDRLLCSSMLRSLVGGEDRELLVMAAHCEGGKELAVVPLGDGKQSEGICRFFELVSLVLTDFLREKLDVEQEEEDIDVLHDDTDEGLLQVEDVDAELEADDDGDMSAEERLLSTECGEKGREESE